MFQMIRLIFNHSYSHIYKHLAFDASDILVPEPFYLTVPPTAPLLTMFTDLLMSDYQFLQESFLICPKLAASG